MSLHYIIDGYNIINHPLFRPYTPKRIKDTRVSLFDFIKLNKRCASLNNKISVIFDGHTNYSYDKIDKTRIHIIFSQQNTADEIIKRMVEESVNPKNIIVVSDDKEIRFFVKSAGAKPMGIEEFINPEGKSPAQEKIFLKPELTYSQIEKINQELRKIWLK